jgi:hypothetical protein
MPLSIRSIETVGAADRDQLVALNGRPRLGLDRMGLLRF